MQYNQGYGGGYGAMPPQYQGDYGAAPMQHPGAYGGAPPQVAFSPQDSYGVPQHPGAYGGLQHDQYGGYQGYQQQPSSDMDDSGIPYYTDQFAPQQAYGAQGYGAMPGQTQLGGGEYESQSGMTTHGVTGVSEMTTATHPTSSSRTGVSTTGRGAGSVESPALVVAPAASGAKRAFTLMLGGATVVFIGIILVIAAKLLLLKRTEGAVKVIKTPKPVKTVNLNLRPPLLFCTLGYNFEDEKDLNAVPCDYLIYSDLIAHNMTFYPLYGQRSWNAYIAALSTAAASTGGISFSLSEGIGPNSTFDLMEDRGFIVKAYVTQGMLALGTFDYEPTAGVPLSRLKNFFKYLNKTLPPLGINPHSMVYLGVILATNVIADSFISEVSEIPEIATLVLQTHITLREAHLGGHTDCHAYPISAVGIKNLANNTVPRLEVAEHALNLSRSLGDKFRIVFSSTMGVMVYKQMQGQFMQRFRQPCSTWNMGDYDVTCDPELEKKLDESDLAPYATEKKGMYLFSFEDEKSLTMKMERYLPSSSDGWCLFDVHRDVYWTCNLQIPATATPDKPFEIKQSPEPMKRVKKVKSLMASIKRE